MRGLLYYKTENVVFLLAGSAPSNRNQWQGGANRSHNVGQDSNNMGRWPGSTNQSNVRPQTAGLVLNTPLIQTPPASQAFLASAANIMLGLGANNARPQDARFDAYKNLPGGNIRRY